MEVKSKISRKKFLADVAEQCDAMHIGMVRTRFLADVARIEGRDADEFAHEVMDELDDVTMESVEDFLEVVGGCCKVADADALSEAFEASRLSAEELAEVYDMLVNGVCDVVATGTTLSLTGFGTFYLQRHKGHPVQFEGVTEVPDYVVFKFSASDVLNRKFRQGVFPVDMDNVR